MNSSTQFLTRALSLLKLHDLGLHCLCFPGILVFQTSSKMTHKALLTTLHGFSSPKFQTLLHFSCKGYHSNSATSQYQFFCIGYFPCFSDKIFDQSNLSKERVIWAFVRKPTLVRNDGISVSLLITLNLSQDARNDKRSYTVHLLLFMLSWILSHGLVLATFRVGLPTLFN